VNFRRGYLRLTMVCCLLSAVWGAWDGTTGGTGVSEIIELYDLRIRKIKSEIATCGGGVLVEVPPNPFIDYQSPVSERFRVILSAPTNDSKGVLVLDGCDGIINSAILIKDSIPSVVGIQVSQIDFRLFESKIQEQRNERLVGMIREAILESGYAVARTIIVALVIYLLLWLLNWVYKGFRTGRLG